MKRWRMCASWIKPLEMDYSVTAPLYAKGAGSLLLVRARVVGSDAEGLDDKPRKVPISFEAWGRGATIST